MGNSYCLIRKIKFIGALNRLPCLHSFSANTPGFPILYASLGERDHHTETEDSKSNCDESNTGKRSNDWLNDLNKHAQSCGTPRACLDIRHVRNHPELYAQNCRNRRYDQLDGVPYRIIELFNAAKKLQIDVKPLRKKAEKLRSILSKKAYLATQRPHVRACNTHDSGPDHSAEDAVQADTMACEHNPECNENDTDEILKEARSLKAEIDAVEKKTSRLQNEMEHLANLLPNLISPHTPIGSEPKLTSEYFPREGHGVGRTSDGAVRSHVEIGTELGLIDFTSATATSGWGWYFLQNEGALLEQTLVNYALEVAQSYGFRVVTPPCMVYSHIANAAGFHPRHQNGETQVYSIAQSNRERPSMVLSGTAEIPFVGMRANTLMEEDALPDKLVGVSRCFRAEAGAHGQATKGLFRVHEFTKVELMGWCIPDESSIKKILSPSSSSGSSVKRSAKQYTEKANIRVGDKSVIGHSPSDDLFSQILAVQRHILASLNLPFRVLEQPSHDLGASSYRKVDMEVYFPSRQRTTSPATDATAARKLDALAFGEVSSASQCTDYQTRRLNTRVRLRQPTGAQARVFPYTCNGTALAVPRIIAALLENGWCEYRHAVWLPSVLRRSPGPFANVKWISAARSKCPDDPIQH